MIPERKLEGPAKTPKYFKQMKEREAQKIIQRSKPLQRATKN